MNRQQAEHILDAYRLVNDEEASAALREVILDAMTEYKASTITIPNITYPQITPKYNKPIVTYGVSE